jgi:hypothetical protein
VTPLCSWSRTPSPTLASRTHRCDRMDPGRGADHHRHGNHVWSKVLEASRPGTTVAVAANRLVRTR